VISAALQDAVAKIGDIRWDASARTLTLACNRFRWEAGGQEEGRARPLGPAAGRRHRRPGPQAARDAKGAVVELLSVAFEPGEAPGGAVLLTFAGRRRPEGQRRLPGRDPGRRVAKPGRRRAGRVTRTFSRKGRRDLVEHRSSTCLCRRTAPKLRRMRTPDSELWNEDLAPTSEAQRTWRWRHFAALWLGMVICVPAYMLASGLIEQGMSAGQAVLTVLLGNLVVLVPMLLIGHAGARWGVPYAVLARASFGWKGARIPAVARAVVACGWYGIQTWIGGGALLTLLGVIVGRKLEGAPLPLLGIGLGQLLSFFAFWGIQLLFVTKGLTAVRKLETWTAPIKVLICGLMVWWAVSKAGGLGPIFHQPSAFVAGGAKAGQFWSVFAPALTAMVGFWATLALNIPDFTRFARTSAGPDHRPGRGPAGADGSAGPGQRA
jgi:hypothetical protein